MMSGISGEQVSTRKCSFKLGKNLPDTTKQQLNPEKESPALEANPHDTVPYVLK